MLRKVHNGFTLIQIAAFPESCCASFATEQEAVSWVERWADAGITRLFDLGETKRTMQSDEESEPSTNHSGIFLQDSYALPHCQTRPIDLDHRRGDGDEAGLTPSLCENTATTSKQELSLSREQAHVLERVIQGESVFFTGSAGAHIRCATTTLH